MKTSLTVTALLISGIATNGCVIKTTTSDAASPEPAAAPAAPSPAAAPAAPSPASPAAAPSPNPAPAPAKPAPAPTPAKPAATPAGLPKPAANPTPLPKPATPAPAPTAQPAQPPPPAPSAQKDKVPQPVFTPPPKPKTKPQPPERKADDANGMPPGMKAGSSMAFWIWRDKDGTWHLRTTTTKDRHRFSGRIWVDGTIKDLKPSTLELEDRLKKEDEGVVAFDFYTHGVIDGFDFKLPAARCVTFHLLIDGKPLPQAVLIGEKQIPAAGEVFRLCK